MIPNIVHFVFTNSPRLGGKPFSLTHYIAIRSAKAVNKPDKIYVHCEYEPSGEWWDLIKPFVTINKVSLPYEIFGNPIVHMAHQADVIRLRLLSEMGGVYMDLDTICVKPYHSFLQNEVVMGLQYRRPVFYNDQDRAFYNIKRKLLRPLVKLPQPEGIRGLANTIIFSKPGSAFLRIWLDSYKTFRGQGLEEKYWDEHSVRMPYSLSEKHPTLVTRLSPDTFYYPYYDDKGLKMMFEKVRAFPNAVIHHLWESVSWEKYCKNLTAEEVLTKDTTYNLLARPYLP